MALDKKGLPCLALLDLSIFTTVTGTKCIVGFSKNHRGQVWVQVGGSSVKVAVGFNHSGKVVIVINNNPESVHPDKHDSPWQLSTEVAQVQLMGCILQ